jgi:DNA repair exonuclease SbcCD ATPase subunit
MTLASRSGLAPLALVAGLTLAACSAPATEGQKKMSQLSEQMQRLESAMATSKLDLQETLEAHDLLVSNAEGDLKANFKRLQSAIENCTERQQQINSLLDQISTTSTSYFAGWEADIDRIDNSDLRSRSEERLKQTRERLQQCQAQVATTRTAFEPVMQTLRDHLLYLSNDLTVGAAASLSKDSGKLRTDVGTLTRELDEGSVPVRECAMALSTSPKN